MTRAEFRDNEAGLRQELLECLTAIEPIGDPTGDTDVWDKVALIDSKLVVTELRPIVKKRLGALFPLKFVRKGGYDSPEEAIAHLLPQLRKWCPVAVSSDTEHIANGAPATPPGH